LKIEISNQELQDREELRTLLIDAATQLAGEGSRLLEARLPAPGHPILLVDTKLQLVIVSFDPADSSPAAETALINGLQTAEQLAASLAWVNQAYSALQNSMRPPRLVIVCKSLPPGATVVLAGCAEISMFRFQVLDINGETGLWLEAANPDESPVPVTGRITTIPPRHASMSEPGKENACTAGEPRRERTASLSLSEEEKRFFQQL